MTDTTANAFDFNALKDAVGADPFAKQTNKFARDERFYVLSKDKEGNGAALIRFLPDSENRMLIQMNKINTTIVKNDKKRFVSEYTPATIGLPCPFQEKWQELWNAGDKDGAKIFGRGIRYITNIKVLKDPANPENEGKIFLYDMSGAVNSKLEKALTPSENDIALGKTPKQLFNPLKGNSFRLVAQKGANQQINYDSSEVVPEENGIYETVEAAVADIKANTHTLSDLQKPEAFLSYDELVKKMAYVTFQDQEATPATATAAVATPVVETVVAPVTVAQVTQDLGAALAQPTVTPVAEVAVTPVTPNANDDLDSILNGMV